VLVGSKRLPAAPIFSVEFIGFTLKLALAVFCILVLPAKKALSTVLVVATRLNIPLLFTSTS
jgi:hypothetical protein